MNRAQAIRALRGLRTQGEFGVAAGVTRVAVSKWERGGEVSIRNARRLIELGLDPAYVLPVPSVAADTRADLSRGAA